MRPEDGDAKKLNPVPTYDLSLYKLSIKTPKLQLLYYINNQSAKGTEDIIASHEVLYSRSQILPKISNFRSQAWKHVWLCQALFHREEPETIQFLWQAHPFPYWHFTFKINPVVTFRPNKMRKLTPINTPC